MILLCLPHLWTFKFLFYFVACFFIIIIFNKGDWGCREINVCWVCIAISSRVAMIIDRQILGKLSFWETGHHPYRTEQSRIPFGVLCSHLRNFPLAEPFLLYKVITKFSEVVIQHLGNNLLCARPSWTVISFFFFFPKVWFHGYFLVPKWSWTKSFSREGILFSLLNSFWGTPWSGLRPDSFRRWLASRYCGNPMLIITTKLEFVWSRKKPGSTQEVTPAWLFFCFFISQ